jgi:hypothetical protein
MTKVLPSSRAPQVLNAKTYSYRKASIGLSREACTAGYEPKKIPTAVETPKASMMDQVVMIVDPPAKWTTSFAIAKPKPPPLNPPSADRHGFDQELQPAVGVACANLFGAFQQVGQPDVHNAAAAG